MSQAKYFRVTTGECSEIQGKQQLVSSPLRNPKPCLVYAASFSSWSCPPDRAGQRKTAPRNSQGCSNFKGTWEKDILSKQTRKTAAGGGEGVSDEGQLREVCFFKGRFPQIYSTSVTFGSYWRPRGPSENVPQRDDREDFPREQLLKVSR